MSSIMFAVAPSPGVAALDELHRSCRDALDELACADPNTLKSGFTELVTRFEDAFRTEDEWMDNLDYPALNSHREQHARVLGALHHVHGELMGGDIALGRHVVEAILKLEPRQWQRTPAPSLATTARLTRST